MDDLSKQQMMLLALLVSFVTSLATGIVTVSLIDQPSTGVTRTVSQVIEKTIQQISPQNGTAAATDNGSSPISAAVDSVAASVVKFQSNTSDIVGTGIILSKSGIIVADKSSVPKLADGDNHFTAVLPDGTKIPVSVVQAQIDGDIDFLAPTIIAPSGTFQPISIAQSYDLGEQVMALSGTSTASLAEGIITESMTSASSTLASFTSVKTSIPLSKILPGSPVFNASGSVIGLRTSSLGGSDGAQFVPIQALKAVLPRI